MGLRKKSAVLNSSAASLACVMVRGEFKAATTVVGPFKEGTVNQCLARLEHHSVLSLFSKSFLFHFYSISIPIKPFLFQGVIRNSTSFR